MNKEFEMIVDTAETILNDTIAWIINNDAKNLEEVVNHLMKDEGYDGIKAILIGKVALIKGTELKIFNTKEKENE